MYMNQSLKPLPHTATLPTISGLPHCIASFHHRHALSKVGPTMLVSRTFRCAAVLVEGVLSRLRAGLLALAIATVVVVLPTTPSRADSVGALANLTGASVSTCQSLLT